MSVDAENVTNASEQSEAEEINASNDQVLPEPFEETIKANLEPLDEQNSTLTQLLNELIQDKWAKTNRTVGCFAHHPQTCERGPLLAR